MQTRIFVCASLFLLLALFHRTASGHAQHNKTQTQTKEETQTNPATLNQTSKPGMEVPQPETAIKQIPMPFSGSMKDHAHNKIIHFPLGFGLAGVLFFFVSLKKPEMITAVRVLWFLAALGSLGAYFTGEAQEEPFEEGALQEVVQLHKNLGIATGISFGVGFLLSLMRRWNGLKALWAIIVLTLLSVAGYYGGLLAHS